ncbi:putative ornithine decarboxylase antizyme protein [Eutypa lata UCREL1]|uniref:Ornithine decarboxylase antizyme n=1 Tax=Eutypa lata (strain UCR-EL1) TaxID=1287681 RepID=M7THW0_EUTLA|nr:putative ornithine decarboxylase antizyme protein [Eutypa lata UCREL1]
MAPMKHSSNSNYSSNHGEVVARQANVLASCYIVDPSASLKGLHYCTTGVAGLPSPPSSPPLAAFTSTNELALQPKSKNRSNSTSSSISRTSQNSHRRGGAALQIREECERFFCESMKTVFQGEWDMAGSGSVLTGVNGTLTPPDDYPTPPSSVSSSSSSSNNNNNNYNNYYRDNIRAAAPVNVDGWMEFWDYAGRTSFRAFVADDVKEKSLFAFFDSGLLNDRRDLKQALIALIELAEGPLECSHVVLCLDREIPEDDNKALMRNLQWAGFELTTLDHWAKDVDVTSRKWLFMGMEV